MPDLLEASEAEQVGFQQTDSRLSPLRLIWRHFWLLVLGVVVGGVVGAFYYARATPIYQSSTQVLVVKKTQEPLPTSVNGMGMVHTEDYLSTHQTLIRSPLIVGNAVQQANLANLPSFAGRGDPTGEIIASLKISRETNNGQPTSILNLSFRGLRAEDTAVVLTAIVESYRRFLNNSYKNVAEETVHLISEANRILEEKLAKKQKEYNDFLAQKPGLLKSKDGLSAVQERLMSLESKRSALLLQAVEIQGRLMALERAVKDSRFNRAELLAMIDRASERSGRRDSNGSMTMDERLMTLEMQEKSLLEDYGPDHPQVRSIRDQLALVRAWMRRSAKDAEKDDGMGIDPVKTYIQSLKLELENTRIAAETLGRLLQEEQRKAGPLLSDEKKAEAYLTEIETSKQLFNTVRKRLDEVSILKDFAGGYEAELIAPPQVGVKVAPRPLIIFTAAVMLGLLAGLGLAYLAELSDQSFRTPEEIRRHLGLPVVGHIPFFESVDQLPPADGPHVDPGLCTVFRPKSREAEAYRGVRTALFFNRQGGHTVIQVTSPDMGDGKSTLIANLAVSMAQAEKKVILLDADFRRPRIHKLFNASAQQGLASVMSGEVELNDVIQTTPIPGLSILPCGPIPPNPAELLSLPRFKELLAYLREKYDFVLVDTPPLLAVTDPCVVAPYVDGVVLTVRISKNARPHASRAKEILATLGARVIGVVVNGVGTDAKGYGYGYKYGYKYYYNYNYSYSNYESDGDSSSDDGGEKTAASDVLDREKKKQVAARSSSWTKLKPFAWLFNR